MLAPSPSLPISSSAISRLAAVSLVLLLMAGCGGLQRHVEEEWQEQYAQECLQEGWEIGTAEHDACLEDKNRQRAEENEKKDGMADSFLRGSWWIGSWF